MRGSSTGPRTPTAHLTFTTSVTQPIIKYQPHWTPNLSSQLHFKFLSFLWEINPPKNNFCNPASRTVFMAYIFIFYLDDTQVHKQKYPRAKCVPTFIMIFHCSLICAYFCRRVATLYVWPSPSQLTPAPSSPQNSHYISTHLGRKIS